MKKAWLLLKTACVDAAIALGAIACGGKESKWRRQAQDHPRNRRGPIVGL